MSETGGVTILERAADLCASSSLPEVLRALAELCDWDAEQFTRDLDDSGVIESCRRDAEELRVLADEIEERHGG